MSREQDIVNEARITLNDVDKQRWADKRLLKLLDDAQQEICREVHLISQTVTINTSSGQAEYKLPRDCIKVLTVRSGGRSVATASMEELDRDNPEWEDVVSNQYTHLVVNNLTQLTIRPFPLMSPDYVGVNTQIKVRYSAKPVVLGYVEVEDEDDTTKEELTISSTWDYALTQYIISKAFIDYGDESSLSRAQVAGTLYLDIMTTASDLARRSFSRRQVTTSYQGRVSNTYRGDNYGSSSCRPKH